MPVFFGRLNYFSVIKLKQTNKQNEKTSYQANYRIYRWAITKLALINQMKHSMR